MSFNGGFPTASGLPSYGDPASFAPAAQLHAQPGQVPSWGAGAGAGMSVPAATAQNA
ncbi:hypothetical protein AURDEDRAFT_166628, partial [Auricularia subglabra TFB-10046 SS5]